MGQGRHGAQAQGPGAEHGHGVGAVDPRRHGGVHGAGRGLDHDGVVVGELVGHGMELRVVGHEASRRPPSAGVAAEADLQPRGEVAEGDALHTHRCDRRHTPRRGGRCRALRTRERAR